MFFCNSGEKRFWHGCDSGRGVPVSVMRLIMPGAPILVCTIVLVAVRQVPSFGLFPPVHSRFCIVVIGTPTSGLILPPVAARTLRPAPCFALCWLHQSYKNI